MSQLEPASILDTAELASKLALSLKEKRENLIPGSQLAVLINQVLPEGTTFRTYFPFGETPRLRTFVERHLPPGLVHPTELRQGSDILFELHQIQGAEGSSTQYGRLWRSFVAVEPRSRLVYDPKTASISPLENEYPVHLGCKELQSVVLEEHKAICKAFIERLAERGHFIPQLAVILENFGERSYPDWLRLLRDNRPLDREWGEFRHAEVLKLFERRLENIGVERIRIAQLREELVRDHEAARGKVVQPTSTSGSAQPGPKSKDLREKRARELLRSAADKLSYEQLQAIVLPVGVMLDILSIGSN